MTKNHFILNATRNLGITQFTFNIVIQLLVFLKIN